MTANNETLGMTVEKVLCDIYGLSSDGISHRSLPKWEGTMLPTLQDAETKLPRLVRYMGNEVGRRGGRSKSSVDFLGAGGETISVKSNLVKHSGKVCPPEVGQPGMQVYSRYFNHLYDETDLSNNGLVTPESFKRVAQERIVDKISIYLEHLFDCDYLLWTWLRPSPGHAVFRKGDLPRVTWDAERFTFSRSPDEWNESCSVRYRTLDPDLRKVRNIPIGEFQVHNNRRNYKFRFVLANLDKVLRAFD